MEAASVVILFEPADEPTALTLGRMLEALGVRCWIEGVEGRAAPTRAEALAACRAIVVIRDEAGGAYGALDAGGNTGAPVFIHVRPAHGDERTQQQAFCARVAAVVGASPRSPPGPSRRRVLALAALGAVATMGLAAWLGRSPARLALAPTPALLGMTATPSGDGWMLVFRFATPPAEVSYELASAPGYRATGELPGVVDPGTGAALAKPYATLGADELAQPTVVRVRYRRPGGSLEGPVEFPLDPAAQRLAWMKSTIDDLGPNWISFRALDQRTLVYFTSLLVYKPALEAIRVGVDDGPLDRPVRFAPSERVGVHDGDELYRTVDPETRSLSVELVFRDGTRSAVRRFVVPPEARPRPAEARPLPLVQPVPPPRTSRPKSLRRHDPFGASSFD